MPVTNVHDLVKGAMVPRSVGITDGGLRETFGQVHSASGNDQSSGVMDGQAERSGELHSADQGGISWVDRLQSNTIS